MNAPTELAPDQQVAWLAERAAVLQCALRRLASAHHRTHADGVTTWTHCADHFCQLAHEAVEGRLRPRNATEHGTVISLVKKEA